MVVRAAGPDDGAAAFGPPETPPVPAAPLVIPAEAGTQAAWVPAFAGMTGGAAGAGGVARMASEAAGAGGAAAVTSGAAGAGGIARMASGAAGADGAARVTNGTAALTSGLNYLRRRALPLLRAPAVALILVAALLALCAWAGTT